MASKKETKSSNWTQQCFKRYLWLLADNPDRDFEDVNSYFLNKNAVNNYAIQFQYFLSSKKAKQALLAKLKNFKPIKIGKLERRYIRSGRLA